MKTNYFRLTLFLVLLLTTTHMFAQIKMPAMFTDNMVLQQEIQNPIWGKASSNSSIKVKPSWGNKEYTTTADKDGNWKTEIETPKAGGPYEIKIIGKETVTLKNVMIGEVWICSGQSNMEMPLAGWGKINNYEKEISQANWPNIRLLQVEHNTSNKPLDEIIVSAGGWQECSPSTIPGFSATAYFFGRNLYENMNIPIGLIHTSWGGTPAESWVSDGTLNHMPEYVEKIKAFQQLPNDKEELRLFNQKIDEEWNAKIFAADFGMENNKPVASELSYDDTKWQKMSIPGLWEKSVLPEFDGIVWFRKTIDIPKEWLGGDLKLSLGAIDDNDITWFNGVELGKTEGASVARNYTIPKHLVKKGKAVITVRVTDTGGDGGFHGDAANVYLSSVKSNSSKKDISGDWKYKVAVDLKKTGYKPNVNPDSPHNPTTLYNAMIAPIVPYGIKGAIWYQGESNADRAYQYRTLFPLMISDWRLQWGYEFPFYFVQLANFMGKNNEPVESAWAELREAQLQTLNLENTGMAVIIDIGDELDIHPKNKQDVGIRLALEARKKTYDQNIVSSGPIYKSYQIENEKIRIFFADNDSKLKINGDKLIGFSIAGPDKKFYWANAIIDGDEIVVSSPNVKFPVAVRYAWANNPDFNLYNEEGLPASPFRTDDWQGLTINNK